MATVDVTALVDAVRETGIGLKPGDVLAVRLPVGHYSERDLDNARAYADAVGKDAGIKVVFVPGEEFAHTTINVTVDFNGSPAELSKEIAEAVHRSRLT